MSSVELDAREVEWEFAQGRKIRGFAYNGQVPGPLIEAEVGDEVAVRLKNSLPQETTIHWHGLRVPATMDGTEAVQPPVAPGESFEYRFVVPDAGTFWYHSHANETEQIERGLYGALVVRGPDEPGFDAERVLVLDDVKLDPHGEIAPFGDGTSTHRPRRRRASRATARVEPELEIPPGQVERWRIVERGSSRYVRLSLGGRPFEIVGTDGGLLTRRSTATEVLLTPGERVELAVGPFEEGERMAIEALPVRPRGDGESAREPFATLRVGPGAPSRARIPATLRAIEPLADPDAEPTRTIDLKRAHARRATHQRRADPRSRGRAAGLGHRERDRHGPPVPPARLLLPGRRGATARLRRYRGLGGHRQRRRQGQLRDRLAARRSARRVDVPLPHPRAPRGGDDGPLRRRPLTRGLPSDRGPTLFDMAKRPTRIDLLELDIDLRLADLWREAADVQDWNLDVVAAFMRAAYGKGYCDALTEEAPGSLCEDHGYRVPPRRQQAPVERAA